MQLLMIAVGIALVLLVSSPFLFGRGGLLAASSSINSKEKLSSLKIAVLNQYIADETLNRAGELSDLAWNKRRGFLVNRYIDSARRLDFLEHIDAAAGPAGMGGDK
jgi:hypothetical protein